MDNKFLCVMAGYDENTEKKLSELQNELYEQGFSGKHTKDLPQHITLGTFPVEQEEELIELVKKVVKETGKFDITFNHIGIFGGSEVLFIAPDTSDSLLELKEHFGDSLNWTPHTTMLIDHKENIFRAIPIVADHFSSFRGQIQSVHLYEFWPTRHILTLTLI